MLVLPLVFFEIVLLSRLFALPLRTVQHPQDAKGHRGHEVQSVYSAHSCLLPFSELNQVISSQLLFSDMSTPKGDGEFNIYDDIRDKLVAMGIPKEEIAFIHEANSDKQKDELYF